METRQSESTSIPKIIHYCWFGKGERSPLIKHCIDSWSKLKKKGYVIKEWNEENCNLDENPYVRLMYNQKKYAFVSDYFRLKALYNFGGIYLDTDVHLYKAFDNLLNADFFAGYIYDCALGTAVIGAKKHSLIIKNLLSQYDNTNGNEMVNNGLFTEFFYCNVPQFKLNGKRQSIEYNGEKIEIYPKEEFETGKIIGRSYTLHFSEGSWHKGRKKLDYRIKLICCRLPINIMAARQIKKAKKYMQKKGKYQEWYMNTIEIDQKRFQ